MSIMHFQNALPPASGMSVIPVLLTDQSFFVGKIDVGAVCSVYMTRPGDFYAEGNGGPTLPVSGQYYSGPEPNIGDQLWTRLTQNSGTPPGSGDSLDVWLPLSTNRVWAWAVVDGTASFTGTLALSDDAAGARILDSCLISVTVESSFNIPEP